MLDETNASVDALVINPLGQEIGSARGAFSPGMDTAHVIITRHLDGW